MVVMLYQQRHIAAAFRRAAIVILLPQSREIQRDLWLRCGRYG
jgi:hypothetical protein